jgi:adenylate cyclase
MKWGLYKRAFKVDLLSCFIGLILFTVIIVVYSYKINTKNTLIMVNELVNTTLNHAVSETNHYLKIAQYTPTISSILFAQHLDILHDTHLEERVIAILKQSPFLFMYYIGDEHGNFIMGYRNQYNSISTRFIHQQAKQPFSITRYRNAKGLVYQEKKSLQVDYDPRQRLWYTGAKNSGALYWTEIYPFFNKEPDNFYAPIAKNKPIYGLSVSKPILNTKQKLAGVVGVDISLTELADFLRTLSIGEHGKALIVDENRKVILFPWVNAQQLLTTASYSGMRVNDIKIDWLKEGIETFFKRYDKDFFYTYNGDSYVIKAYDFSSKIGKNWYLIIVVPVNDFLAESKQTRTMSLLMTSAMLILSILFSLGLSRSLSRPIEIMTRIMRQVNELNFANLEHLNSPIKEFHQMSKALMSMTQGLKAFLKYVPPEVVAELIKKGQNVTLGGHEMNLTLFFSDIEGFTHIAEETAPIELMTDLSYYFDKMVKVIVLDHQGTIDKYIGDSVMAFWGAPHYTHDHAKLACHAALACQKEIAQLNAQRIAEGKGIFHTRIGIHTGMTIVGNIGSSDRFNYTVIGDSVNLASRLEGLNKLYHSTIIVGHATYRQVYQFFVFRPLDFIIVKGKNEGIKIYQLMAEKNQCDNEILQLAEQARLAFKYYLNKEFELALKTYFRILAYHPHDKPARVMIEKCQKLIDAPPDENWTGATRVFEK